ncbi:MAG: hypothetical protein ERJ67_09430 [Aphanocapsa feldmannii 277cV]|uniref:Uncharacterized protein n=1 Tax=Aphanocapsa feldmannii 277cV TaxID=2507553 RepID=A0A524RLG3_9CHRO|nr:MAG: hypothetical protein ERJ67_09430 [Aphanocapsa feldmannii 277cV]
MQLQVDAVSLSWFRTVLSFNSLATTMLSAGMTSHLNDVLLPAEGTGVVDFFQRNLISNTVHADFSATLKGGELGELMLDSLRLAAAQALGEVGVKEIRDKYIVAGLDGKGTSELASKTIH